ncbi:ankyrin repeat domain-containing protein [Lysobacter maris]|uniref:Ankyrin repeat domain-containing protein n=1 Tax=Marilutibacter maris TaxID=1605891 RepID=A0A508B4D5_9GAMM|nr:ankyrin repeat domain-containing protein [Lysobacter maris]KAB8195627.1 ankyrin repeat domain-containing protein [Lysobacter maris]
MRTIEEILQSTSDVLFPADGGCRRVSMDSRSYENDTPLHVLLWRRDFDGAKALIEAGADVNAIGDMGQTPLHLAIHQGRVDIAEALLLAGANPDIRSEFGETPRSMAAARKDAIAGLVEQTMPGGSTQSKR